MIVLVKILRKTSFLIAQLLLGFFVLIIGCGSHRDLIQISGQTMGTTYSIKIILESEQINPEQIKSAIDSILTIINKQMSTWDPTSEISQFNSFKSTEPFQVSKSFANVVESALDISEKTNGVFDILHKGHIELLKFSKSQGNKLIVAIDSDERVRELKGPDRPINNEEDRRKVLETNIYVDSVVTFSTDDELKGLYNSLSPSVLVKGSEWTADEIRERDSVPDNIQVKVYPLVGEYSTTNTMRKIRGMETCEKV